MKTERIRMPPEEYLRRYADACVKADVVPAPLVRNDDDDADSGDDDHGRDGDAPLSHGRAGNCATERRSSR